MAFTNSAESTTEALAGIEEERTARGAKANYLPYIAVFAFGTAKRKNRQTFIPAPCASGWGRGYPLVLKTISVFTPCPLRRSPNTRAGRKIFRRAYWDACEESS